MPIHEELLDLQEEKGDQWCFAFLTNVDGYFKVCHSSDAGRFRNDESLVYVLT